MTFGAQVELTTDKIPGRLIAVAGLIGVGKTTLAENLASLLDLRLIHEDYINNPFLARQFQGDTAAALPSELYFLLSRARQLDRQHVASGETVIADYIFEKNRLFASLSLNEAQFSIYDQIESAVVPYITCPDLVIYLSDTIENCLRRIGDRGRKFEQSITPGWLSQLQLKYEAIIDRWTISPVLKVNCEGRDFRRRSDVMEIVGRIDEYLFNV